MQLALDGSTPDKPIPFLKRRAGKLLLVVAGIVVVAGAGVAIGAAIATSVHGGVRVPAEIARQLKSPAYIPTYLPGTYKVSDSSFMFDEDVLVFSAKDASGSSLVFTEQGKPENFNFNNFYQSQMDDAKTADSGDYSSAWGKTKDGRFILSVVTKDAWVVMTANLGLGDDEVRHIASSLTRVAS